MKKKLTAVIIAVLLVALTFSLVACNNNKDDLKKVQDKGEMVMGITLFEPMNYEVNGVLTGFETEFAQEVCKRMGIKAKFQVINWDQKFIELNAGNIDCIWNGFTVDDERRQQSDFSQSYLNNTQCIVVKTSNLANFPNKEAFAGKKGIAEAGSAGEDVAKDLSDINEGASNQQACLLEVKADTSDFAVIDVILANAQVGKGDYQDLSIVNTVTLEPEEYAIGFRKGSNLVALVNEKIKEMLADGSLENIAKKYNLEGQLIK